MVMAVLVSLGADDALRAGRDAPVPERLHHVPPEYPVTRGAFPSIMGIVALDVTLNEEGRPVDIRVLRGTPPLDRAAIEAVRQWRYKPTVVAGTSRQVVVLEVLDMFPDEGSKRGYFADMLKDKKEVPAYRLLAIERLKVLGAHDKAVLKALQKASTDPDEAIRNAAAEALGQLAAPEKR
jgi:TonB family protein